MSNFEIVNFPDSGALADAAAGEWLKKVNPGTAISAPYCVALSGGRIAQKFFSSIARLARAQGEPLSSVHFFWADERCVPPGDPDSNYSIARRYLLEPLNISPAQVHRIRGEDSPDAAAKEASAAISQIAPNVDGRPVLDMVFLGMGEDGHVASLFPGESPTAESGKTAYRAINSSPKPPPNRVSLDYPAIIAAREVWALVSGAEKTVPLRESLSKTGQTPFARVLKMRQRTKIFTDIVIQ